MVSHGTNWLTSRRFAPGRRRYRSRMRGFALVKATFELADGSTYPDFFSAVRPNWDEPIPGRRMKDSTYTKPLQWSARRTGGPLTILSLHRPVILSEVTDSTSI